MPESIFIRIGIPVSEFAHRPPLFVSSVTLAFRFNVAALMRWWEQYGEKPPVEYNSLPLFEVIVDLVMLYLYSLIMPCTESRAPTRACVCVNSRVPRQAHNGKIQKLPIWKCGQSGKTGYFTSSRMWDSGMDRL
jgi:hypothetical protein